MSAPAFVAVFAIAAALMWLAAENHYDNCVQAATARTPLRLTAEDAARVQRLERSGPFGNTGPEKSK